MTCVYLACLQSVSTLEPEQRLRNDRLRVHRAAQVLESGDSKVGFNAATGAYEDMFAAGIIDPAKVCCPTQPVVKSRHQTQGGGKGEMLVPAALTPPRRADCACC